MQIHLRFLYFWSYFDLVLHILHVLVLVVGGGGDVACGWGVCVWVRVCVWVGVK